MVVLIGIAILALLALIVIATSFRKRDTYTAIGQLSGETVKRDRSRVAAGVNAGAVDDVELTGSAIEAAARAERSGELVSAESSPPVVYVPPDPETLGVTRRQFLNRGIVAMFGLGLAAFGAAVLAQLWPQPTEGFGAKINVGKVPDIKDAIVAGGGFFYFPQGRMWLTEYPTNALAKAESTYSFYPQVSSGLENGVVALFQTCPHLGCRVPDCQTSQWFECPCHGSQYNQVGEKKGGPAPRGMDRFPMEVTAGGDLLVDTGNVIQGPPIGVNTTGQEAEGPNCLGAGGGH
ncbi:MAG: ubiquinol-cytochrome c reductase iron-sulfur subunit [Acidimicrobiales bacterium]